jgi:hypothetical protein
MNLVYVEKSVVILMQLSFLLFYFTLFLLAYCYCAVLAYYWGTLWYLQKCLQYILMLDSHPPVILLYPSSLSFLRIVTFLHFLHDYIIFPPYWPSFNLSLCPSSSSHWNQSPDGGLFYLFSFIFEKKNFCLRELYREFHYDISTYGCIIFQTGSIPWFHQV